MRRPNCLVIATAFVLVAGLSCATSYAGDYLLYSWEGSLENWTAANATLVNATGFGNTHGAQSMLMDDLGGGFRNDVGVATVNSGNAYDGWGLAGTRIAAGDTDVALEFDFTFDNGSATAAFAQLAIFVNSTDVPPGSGGFRQYGTGGFIGGNIGSSFPTLDAPAIADGVTMTGVGNTRHLRIPMNAAVAASGGQGLTVGPPSGGSFYQIGFKSNGGWTGTVDWAIDNMRITGANIPEPSSIALLTICLAGLHFGRRRCG